MQTQEEFKEGDYLRVTNESWDEVLIGKFSTYHYNGGECYIKFKLKKIIKGSWKDYKINSIIGTFLDDKIEKLTEDEALVYMI